MIKTPPIARTGIAGNSNTAINADRRPSVVSNARRYTPHAVRPPTRTAGNRTASINEPVSLTLIGPSNVVASRISHAISGPRE